MHKMQLHHERQHDNYWYDRLRPWAMRQTKQTRVVRQEEGRDARQSKNQPDLRGATNGRGIMNGRGQGAWRRRDEREKAPENATTNITRGVTRGRGVTTGKDAGRGGGEGASGGPLFPCIKILFSYYPGMMLCNITVCQFWLEDHAKMSTVGFYWNSLIWYQ